MEKRGGVTIYILLGLFFLLLVGFGVYYVQRTLVKPVELEIRAPPEIAPVYDFVTACMSDAARRGVLKMGLQGGFIEVPEFIARQPRSFVALDQFGIIKIPYWYYEGENRIPGIPFMQKQLENYVNKNLHLCIKNFTAVSERFEVFVKEAAKAKTTFTQNDVVLELKWPLAIRTAEVTRLQEEFIVKLPVKLKQAWDAARRIMIAENEQQWFENLTVDLLMSDPEMPTEGIEISCGKKKWYVDAVKESFQRILEVNIPRIRVEGTKYPAPDAPERIYNDLMKARQDIREVLEAGAESFTPPRTIPEDAFEYIRMKFDAGIPPTDLKTGFAYRNDWGMEMNIKPRDGPLLESNNVRGARKYISFFCVNQWHFTYDMIFPVVGLVADETAFDGEGFVFQYPFPVLIKDNEGQRKYFSYNRFDTPTFAQEYCDNRRGPRIDVIVKGFTGFSPFAMELKDVNVTYRCLTQSCLLGQTYNDGSGHYRLRTATPEGCINPVIIAQKEGYLDGSAQVTKELVDVTLVRLLNLSYEVVKHKYHEFDKKLKDAEPLGEYDKAMIYVFFRNFDNDQLVEYPADTPTMLLAGNDTEYDINIILTDRQGSQIGGYNAENMKISYERLIGAEKVVFHVLEYAPHPKTDKQKGDMIRILFNDNIRSALGPEFE